MNDMALGEIYTGHVSTRADDDNPAGNLLDGDTGKWEIVVGLEVHAQVASEAKLFSGASAAFGGAPNSHVSLVDAAMPGMLPVINAECVRQAVRTGLGLEAQINLRSVFDRKNYFYPDLPAGYQISQFKQPIVGAGKVVVDMPDGRAVTVAIERLHLEQDAGKSLHDQQPGKSYIDLNRAGVALMEIVSRPDLRSGDEAAAYLAKLRTILRYIGSCDGDMSQGSMRADVNVSVHKPGTTLGTRCEIKNVNSVRFVRQAVEYEARRQIGILEGGGTIVQETRLFDTDRGETRLMRSKEEAHDYRYFPDPDLLPLVLSQGDVDELARGLPELPDARKARFTSEYGLSPYDATVLTGERARADFFEAVLGRTDGKPARDPKTASNWVASELIGRLNKDGREIDESQVTAAQLGGLLDLIADGTITGRIAKDVFDEMFATGTDAAAIVEANGLRQIADTGELEAVVEKIIADNPGQAEQYRVGKTSVAGWFTGQAMKATRGKANPQIVNEILARKLGGG